jgi:ethanolamine utilization protein EutN
MYLARIEGTLTAAARHDTLAACRFLLARRLETDGTLSGEPLVVLDRLGARHGSTVLVSTDGDALRRLLGDTTPARLSVVGLVDAVTLAPPAAKAVATEFTR